MFDHLFQDDEEGGDAAAAAAAAPDGGDAAAAAGDLGRGRGRGRHGGRQGGRSRGFAHSEATRAKIAAGVQRRRVQNSIEAVGGLVAGDSIARVQNVFSSSADAVIHQSRRSQRLVIGNGGAIACPVDGRTTLHSDRDRVLVSHVHRQASGLAAFVAPSLPDDADAGGLYLDFTNVHDDASMWIATPPEAAENRTLIALAKAMPSSSDGAKLMKRQQSKGRMKHAPVLNVCETIIKTETSSGHTQIAGASVASPPTVMPEANASTLYNRWRRWTCGTGGLPGQRVDPDGALSGALSTSAARSWKGITVVKDCLQVNDNIMWEVEARVREATVAALTAGQAPDYVPTVTHRNCAGHSTVLCTKPLAALFPGLSGHIVREGHLCQSSRSSRRYDAALEKVVRTKFRFRKVLVYPDGFAIWQRYARHVLDRTDALRDLSPAMKEEIIYYVNDRWWNFEEFIHWCIPGCRCGRVRGPCLEKIICIFRIISGPSCPLALEYRWKNVEEGACWDYRGRACHDVSHLTFQEAYDTAAIKQARERLAAQGGQEGGAVDLVLARQTVQAGAIIDHMDNDAGGKSTLKFLIVQTPLQRSLNDIFLAERKTTEFVSATLDCVATPTGSAPESLIELRNNAFFCKLGDS